MLLSRTRTLAVLVSLVMSTFLLTLLLSSDDNDNADYQLQQPRRVYPSKPVINVTKFASRKEARPKAGQSNKRPTTHHAAPNINNNTTRDVIRLCDIECFRFRERLHNWPAGKPKAAIYYLSHVFHFLNKSIRHLDLNFNRQHQYPIIIFHEPDFRVHVRDIIKLVPDVYFQEITFKMPGFIKGPVMENIPCLSPISYRHMCRFQTKLIYQEPIMEGLDYYWRLDDDSLINEPIRYDVFQFMRDGDMAYGYTWIHLDSFPCTLGLWDAVEEYIDKKHIEPQFFHEWPSPQIYYNNLEISSMALWRSQEYKDYIEYIDKLGGIYYHRWGDAPIKGIAISLFVAQNRTHHFKDIGYEHGTYDSRRVHGFS